MTTDGPYPLSRTQEAQWFLHRLAPDSGAYNTGVAVRVRSALDLPLLRNAVSAVTDRHEMLRSLFGVADGTPVRLVRADAEAETVLREQPEADEAALRAAVREELNRPFDPAERPPFRVALLTTRGATDSVLLVAGHHIATDAASNALVLRDLLRTYRHLCDGGPGDRRDDARPGAGRPAGRYQDHVDKERRLLGSARGTAMGRHWSAVCAGSSPAELPADHRRPAGQSFTGDTWRVALPPGLAVAVRQAALEWGITPYSFLLGAFQALLYRCTGRRDFLIGAPVTTRLSSRMRDVVGSFMNTIVLRARFGTGSTFRDTAVAADEQVRAGMGAARYPFPLIARAVRAPRAAGRSALVQITFNMLSTAHLDGELRPVLDTTAPERVTPYAGLLLSPWHLPQQEGQLDLAVDVLHSGDAFAVDFRYDTGLYEHATVRRLAGYYLRAIELAAHTPDARVAAAPMWQPVGGEPSAVGSGHLGTH